MINVVHILNTNSYSGAENVVITIINNLKNNANYNMIYVAIEGPIEEILKENDINYYLVDKLSCFTLKKVISNIKPDVIHCHDFTASILASLVTKKIPIISHLHNNPLWIQNRNIKSLAYKYSLKYFDIVLGVSSSIFDEYKYSNKIKNYKVISNPVDLSQIKPEKIEKEDNFDIIFLGRLTQQKNPLRFLNIVSNLKKVYPTIKVAIVGDGELRTICENYILEHDLKNNVYLKGFQKNRFDFINNSKIMCITSQWEGFGLMAIESLALGKPVLSTPVGGLVDIVDNKVGKICLNDDDYIIELEKLLNNQEYYNEKHINALIKAKKIENINEYIRELKKIYNSILKREKVCE